MERRPRHVTQLLTEKVASWPVYALALVPALAFFGLLYVQPWLPMASLIRDPVAILGGRFYHGLVSNLGVLLWCGTAAVCLFRGAEVWRAGARQRGGFLLSAGSVTLMLLLDDFFLAHEQILPNMGIPEKATLAFYPLAVALYVAVYWRQTIRADAALLVLSLAFLAISNLVDVVFGYHFYPTPVGQEVSAGVILEEGAKFVGIAAWSVFHIRAAWIFGGSPTSGRAEDRPPKQMPLRSPVADS
jgi:hypothetical protein